MKKYQLICLTCRRQNTLSDFNFVSCVALVEMSSRIGVGAATPSLHPPFKVRDMAISTLALKVTQIKTQQEQMKCAPT